MPVLVCGEGWNMAQGKWKDAGTDPKHWCSQYVKFLSSPR